MRIFKKKTEKIRVVTQEEIDSQIKLDAQYEAQEIIRFDKWLLEQGSTRGEFNELVAKQIEKIKHKYEGHYIIKEKEEN